MMWLRAERRGYHGNATSSQNTHLCRVSLIRTDFRESGVSLRVAYGKTLYGETPCLTVYQTLNPYLMLVQSVKKFAFGKRNFRHAWIKTLF
jgi:hypothetical protein